MKLVASTYRTLTGTKEVLEIPKKKSTEWVIYQDNQPKYYVDLFDLKHESNAMMNSLVLCGQRSIKEVLKIISQRNNVQLSIPEVSFLSIEISKENKEVALDFLPEEWLDYSL